MKKLLVMIFAFAFLTASKTVGCTPMPDDPDGCPPPLPITHHDTTTTTPFPILPPPFQSPNKINVTSSFNNFTDEQIRMIIESIDDLMPLPYPPPFTGDDALEIMEKGNVIYIVITV
ncbi:MAG: hypothetical protein OXC82_11480 [Rhodobacteraceae bacterium]|nr:hypothetical protein [Paracoccaceae bacterium]MCY4251038.1 hypothetical protein [Paracoccaceae bacterium]